MDRLCAHDELISVKRRVTGWEIWSYFPGRRLPFEFEDDFHLKRSLPKSGICGTCGKRVEVKYPNEIEEG